MGTLTGSKAGSGVQARSHVAGTVSVYAEYTASATVSAGDVVQMVKVPKGAMVTDMRLSTNTLADQGAHLQVGDGVDTDRYISASGGTVVAGTDINQASGLGYEYTADDTIDIKVVVVGGTATAAAVYKLTVQYTMDESTIF